MFDLPSSIVQAGQRQRAQAEQRQQRQAASRKWDNELHKTEFLTWAQNQYKDYDWRKYLTGASKNYTNTKTALPDPASVFWSAKNQFDLNMRRVAGGQKPITFKDASYDPSQYDDAYNEQVGAYTKEFGVHPLDMKQFNSWRVTQKYKDQYTNTIEDERNKAQGLPPLRVQRAQSAAQEMETAKQRAQQLGPNATRQDYVDLFNTFPTLRGYQAYADQQAYNDEQRRKEAEKNGTPVFDVGDLFGTKPTDALPYDEKALGALGYDRLRGFNGIIDDLYSASVGKRSADNAAQITQGWKDAMTQPAAGQQAPAQQQPAAQAAPQPQEKSLFQRIDEGLVPVSQWTGRVLNAPQSLYLNSWNAVLDLLAGRKPQYNADISGAQYAADAVERYSPMGATEANNIPAMLQNIYTNPQTRASMAKALGMPEDSDAANVVSTLQGMAAQLPYEAATDPATALGVGEAAFLARGGKALKIGDAGYAAELQAGKLTPKTNAGAIDELNAMEADQAAGVAQREATETAATRAVADAATAPAVTVSRGLPKPKPLTDFTVTPEGQALKPGQQAPLALPAGNGTPQPKLIPRIVEAPTQILPKELRNLKKKGIVPNATKLSDVNAALADAQRAAGRTSSDATANTLRTPLMPKPVLPTAYPNAGKAWGQMPQPRALPKAPNTANRTLVTPSGVVLGKDANAAAQVARSADNAATAGGRTVAQSADNIVDELTVDPRVEARAAKAKEFADQPGGTLESAAQKISYDVKSPRPKLLSAFDRLRSQMVDKYANIERAEKTILGKLPGADTSAYKQARLYAGVSERANLAIQKELNPIIKSVEKTGKTYKDLGLYSLAAHAKDVNAAGMVSGFTNAEIDDVIRRLGTPEMEQARKALVDYSNRRLDTLVESGRISREAVDAMRAKWKNYIPLSRAMDESETGFIKGVSDSFASVAQPIKGLQGSERNVIDPIESLMRNTYMIENAAGRAEVGRRLGMLADADGEQRFFRKLTDKEAEGKAYVIKAYQNGKEVKYETTKEIFNEVAGMNKEQSASVLKILSAPASVLRAGATLTPEFAIRNPIRDVMNAWFVSDVGFNPITDFPRGLASAIRKDDLYQEFIKAKGGFGNLVSMDRAQYRAAIEGAINQPVTKRFVTILNPKSWIEGLRAVSDATETATKVGVFGAARRKGLSAAEAAYQARDTLDFARVGSAVQPANRIIAFLNANIQGKSKLIRAIQERPVKTLSKVAVGMTLPSIGAFLWNRSVANEEQKRTIDDAPTWLRDTFWLMAIPGTNQVARIPKPFDLAVFSNTTERFMDYAIKKDPKAFDGFAQDVLEQQGFPIMPTGLLPLVEGMANYSFFRQGPIVPRREENIEMADQYDTNTSEVAKGASAAVRAITGERGPLKNLGSPRVMDYAIKSSTAGLGGYALDAIDTLLEGVGLVPNKNRTARNPSQFPLAKAFLVNESGSGKSMEFVYAERDAMTRTRNSFRQKNPNVQYPDEAKYRYITAAADAVGELSAQIRDLENSQTMTPEVKRDEINSLNEQRNSITQAAKKQYDNASGMVAGGYAVVMPFVLTGTNPKTKVEKTIVLTPEQQGNYQQEFQQRVANRLSQMPITMSLAKAEERQKEVDSAIEKIRTAMRNEILWGR
jgi:hypothetical protein